MITIPIQLVGAMLVTILFLGAMLVISEYYYHHMKKAAKEASEGWRRAVEGWNRSHTLLEEVTKPSVKKEIEWPDEIQ